ncbi:uncharacterized protein LOC131238830 [Magnolia sinica]|uniref:uncharacterized protein LOC131238830 n=1 Tax=Magnolia sinica TaxID=86752 RepID=UPI002658D3A9|nr:uncharacterized protein LOC131238830 [Magnolia sinica]
MEAQLEELQNQIKSMHRDHQTQAPVVVEAMIEETEPPFTSEIMDTTMPSRFRMPPSFNIRSILHNPHRGCEKLVPTTQVEVNRHFAKLSRAFLTQFIIRKKSRKSSTYLLTLKQKSGELLKDYISRFNEEALQVDDYSDKISLTTIINRLKDGSFLFSIRKNPSTTLKDLINRAQKYINVEEFFSLRKSTQGSEHSSKDKKCKDASFQPSTSKKMSDEDGSLGQRPSRKSESRFSSYTPLNTSPEKILLDIRDKKLLHWPSCMKTEAGQRDKRRYCRFHHDHGHNTSDCVDLKEEIETLIRKCHLHQYIKKGERLGKTSNRAKLQMMHKNVFAWSHQDMSGITPEVMVHKLNVDSEHMLVKQKRRAFESERYAAITEEVAKLLDAGFIEEVHCLDWITNVVLIKKANEKWRVCVDYSDLNKACPKDSFPLSRINQLVDNTAGHELLTFMDVYSGYNQIIMHSSDKQKTTFVTDKGLYCYQVMPFGLKNARVTYQRLVNKMLTQQIGKTMKVYVDDMLVKSIISADHTSNLAETFSIIQEYQIRLNPTKYVFNVGFR